MSTRTFTFNVTAVGQPTLNPTWLAGKALNTWFTIPGTAPSTAPVSAPTTVPGGTSRFRGFKAWQGGSLRRADSSYIIAAAGGHGDYAGNEVYSIWLETDSPAWVERRGPTQDQYIIDKAAVYLDYRRASTHTYNTLLFDEAANRLVLMPYGGMDSIELPDPSAEFLSTFNAGVVTASFGFGINDWDAAEMQANNNGNGVYPKAPYANAAGSMYATARNHATGDMYVANNNARLMKLTPGGAGSSWSVVTSSFNSFLYRSMAIDHTRNVILAIGSYAGNVAPTIHALSTGLATSVSFTGLGAAALTYGGYGQVIYDEGNDRFLAIRDNGLGVAITMHTVTNTGGSNWDVQEVTQFPSPLVEDPVTWAICNRMQYVPRLKCLIFARGWFEDLYAFRLS